MRALVSGAIANKHRNGGAAQTRLNWTLGLKTLGLDVLFVEQLDDSEGPLAYEKCGYFERTMNSYGLGGTSALITDDGRVLTGVARDDLQCFANSADLLINITGNLTYRPLFDAVAQRVYIDLDPGYTQYWLDQGLSAGRTYGHEHFFTVGENIGTALSMIPTAGIPWQPIRQPIVLEHWPVRRTSQPVKFTTVASWRGPYGRVWLGEHSFGLKVHEFRKFVSLPSLVNAEFEIALDIHAEETPDLELLEKHQWQLKDPNDVAGDASTFRSYVQDSGAEFSAAQGIYVETNSGWFSDRTVRYLASGKPALVQETGFSQNLPTGAGLISFETVEEAAAGAESIIEGYDEHCRAAREIAEKYFDCRVILGELLESVAPIQASA